ncbi:hypothetical protein OsccyDRAFT_0467 [Leptolyngbyaceae cyanobacterium JSC-12]|nr:hypothetical protein OsccyDRAFT_0467 [Leptolyngbyaceae cyanobacterium JSC-12]
MRVGIVGYSGQEFDHDMGRVLVCQAFDALPKCKTIEIVSGLTRLGIPAIAYEEAVKRGWKTVGIACSKAFEYECFPVDETIIVGDDWGDESQTFLNSVDWLIRIGGGKQSHEEARLAQLQGKKLLEFELAAQLASC